MNHQFEDIRSFIHVVDCGGISAAASQLGVSKSVLSARLTRLERTLKRELLHRSPRGTYVTDAGKLLYDRMSDVMERTQQALDEVSHANEASLRGSLRVTAPMTFGTNYVGPILFDFVAGHPDVDLTLDLDDRFVDILASGYDLGVRIGRLQDSSLRAHRLAASPRVLCCGNQYARRTDLPQTVEAIQAHACICYGSAGSRAYWEFQAGSETRHVVVRGRVHVNNGEGMRDAAIAGLGLAILPLFIAGPALESGALRLVLPDCPPTEDSIYAVYPPTRYVSRPVRSLIDLLVERLRDFEWQSVAGVGTHVA